jgi:superfamily II DNA/RNA helicase
MLGPEGKAVEGLEGLPRAVVLTSTRELCVQVQTVLTQLQGQEAEESQQLNARVVHGEQEFPSPHDQSPVDILITTPMCLAHNIRRLNGDKLASAARVVVWDEADMLLQGAFLKDSHEIVATLLRKERQDHTNKQFVFAGATFPTSGRKSVAAFLKKNFQNAEWAYGNEFHKARSNLEETWIEAPEAADKSKVTLQTLRGWLSQEDTEEPNGETLGPQRALVFTESATSAGRVHESLAQSSALAEVPVTLYHSKLKRDERQAVMNDFTNNEDGQPHKVLICTDLAARGIDYTGVSLVIQYDFASNVVGHFHRVGRAGRTWKDGTAMAKAKVTNLVAEKNQDLAKIVQLAATDSRKIQDSFSRRRGLRKRLKQRAKGETYKGQKI